MVHSNTVIVLLFVAFVLGMLVMWWFQRGSRFDLTEMYEQNHESIDWLAEHIGVSAELVTWDMIVDVLDTWLEAHHGADEGCDVY